VVSVKVTATEIEVTFNSDLIATTVSGVSLVDSQGSVVAATVAYRDRTVILSGIQLNPGGHYRLIVRPTVRDVGGKSDASEYSLDLVGPGDQPAAGAAPVPSGTPTGNFPSPSPSPS
jgi:hypothetical protein